MMSSHLNAELARAVVEERLRTTARLRREREDLVLIDGPRRPPHVRGWRGRHR